MERTYREDLLKRLRDPAYAVRYLHEVLDQGMDIDGPSVEEETCKGFHLALRDVAEAHGIIPPQG